MLREQFSAVAMAALMFSCVAHAQSNEGSAQLSEDSNADVDVQQQAQREDIKRQPIPDSERIGVIRRSIIIVDDAQRIASQSFGDFMGQIDGFFSNAGSDDDAVSNESWARIRIDGVRSNGEGFELNSSIKVRAVLPRTERKLKLLISTEDDDGREAGDAPGAAQQGSQNASLALRFIRGARRNSDVNLDIGVRRRDGAIQHFGRLKARFKLDIDDNWIANAANSYFYYSKSGYENRLSFDFRRRLLGADNFYLRTYTQFDWEKGQKGAIISHTTGLYWLVDQRRSFAFEGSGSYHTSLNPGISDRFRGHEVRIRWRHNIWRPWFFYEVWPSIGWPSSTRYRQTEGILLRAEVMIGKPR